ncbi:hypothetical protein [Amnibacterium soli]
MSGQQPPGGFAPGQFSPMARNHRRRTIVRRALVVAALVLALVVVAVLWPSPTPGGLSVATAPGKTKPTGVLQGALTAARTGDRVCYSVPTRGSRAVLRFAEGWTADSRLGLRDPAGLVVAQPGDEVVLLGAPSSVGTVPGCPTRGRIWTVTTLRLPTQG